MGVKIEGTSTIQHIERGDLGNAHSLEHEDMFSNTDGIAAGAVHTEAFTNLANAAAWLIGEQLTAAVGSTDPLLQSMRHAELAAVEERSSSSLVITDPLSYLQSRSGGMYLPVEAESIRHGEHQIVAPLGNGLVLKTKVGEQQLEQQTSGDTTFVRVAAEPYKWENLTAECALAELGISVPIAPTKYFKAEWVQDGEQRVPTLIPVQHPGATFKHSKATWATTPNVAIASDLSQGGTLAVLEFFDDRIKALANYDAIKESVDKAAETILDYCAAYKNERGEEKKNGYQASFSLHATPEPGYSVYDSEVRRIFFVVVDPKDPTEGRLVIGDLDGLSLKKET